MTISEEINKERRLQFPASMEAILQRTQEIANEVTRPLAETTDREAQWPEPTLRALQSVGLGGLVVPEHSGGLGLGLEALVRVCEILGRECPSSALCFGMHCVGSAVIASKATSLQREQYLMPIAEGKHLTTLALSEPGTGAHFYLPETQLATDGADHYRVTGTKSFVTNGGRADSYVVSTVAADPDAPPGEFSCVVIPKESDGLEWSGEWKGIGMRGNSSLSAELAGIRVPRRDLLGEEGDQIWYIFHVVAPYFLTAMAGTYLGLASAALEEARLHLGKRTYSYTGGSLAQVTVLQHRLGTLWATVERTRRLTYYAAAESDMGGTDGLLALASAKAEVADCAITAVNEAMTLTGGIGYARGGRLERLMRDARAAHVMAPTTDILRTWAGRILLGHPLLGD